MSARIYLYYPPATGCATFCHTAISFLVSFSRSRLRVHARVYIFPLPTSVWSINTRQTYTYTCTLVYLRTYVLAHARKVLCHHKVSSKMTSEMSPSYYCWRFSIGNICVFPLLVVVAVHSVIILNVKKCLCCYRNNVHFVIFMFLDVNNLQLFPLSLVDERRVKCHVPDINHDFYSKRFRAITYG